MSTRAMRSAATFAIAASRARALWRLAILLIAGSALAGAAIQLIDPATSRIAANVLFTALVAITLAYANGDAARTDPFAAVEEAAPLFGRQRARANAVFPAAVVVGCAAAQYIWPISHASTFPWEAFVVNAAAALTALPIALSVPLRSRRNGVLYAIFALAAALLCASFGSAVGNSTQSDLAAVLASIGVAIMIGVLALRQYGEALARYDPLPRTT
ncbi:MAG: hypothetical protein JO177_07070 [Candidatus Eremiobacteraeota bacterium]|nr:hypothetical protein [Candidatus Eremiobacteraeota bacterium]